MSDRWLERVWHTFTVWAVAGALGSFGLVPTGWHLVCVGVGLLLASLMAIPIGRAIGAEGVRLVDGGLIHLLGVSIVQKLIIQARLPHLPTRHQQAIALGTWLSGSAAMALVLATLIPQEESHA